MANNTNAATVKSVPTEAEVLAAREHEIRKTYKRVVPGSIQRETSGSHAGKLTVEIKCAARGCENVRRVATSDLFQVRYCEDCTVKLRNKKRREKALAARKEKTDTTTAPAAKAPKKDKKNRKKAAMATPAPAVVHGGNSNGHDSFRPLPTTRVEEPAAAPATV